MTDTNVQGERLVSIDVMRGLTLAAMIVVNMAISQDLSWSQLLHSNWNGFTLADAIYPSFLFVVGSAMALVFEREGRQPPGWGKIARRAALLVACGMFVSNFPFGWFDDAGAWLWKSYTDFRIPGVLQRIGIAYLLAAVIVRTGGARAAIFYVLLALPLCWGISLAFGDLTLAGSAVLKTDIAIFGPSHLYTGEGQPFDPEGLLGTLPATANLLAGYLALRHLIRAADRAAALRGLALVSLALIALALVWAQALPFNKKLWSSSYALLNIGLDGLLLAGLGWLVDIRGWRRGCAFLSVLGRNPLALYMLAEVLMALSWTFRIGDQPVFMAIFDHVFLGQVSGKTGSFAFGLAMVALCWAVGGWMDRRRLYIRL